MQPTKTASQIEQQLEQLRSQLEAQATSPQTALPAVVQALEAAIAQLEAQLLAAPQPEAASTLADPSDTPQESPRTPRLLACNGKHKANAKLYGHLIVEGEGEVCLEMEDGIAIACRVFGQNRKQGLEKVKGDQLYRCTIYPRIREGRIVGAQLSSWKICEELKEEEWTMVGVLSLRKGYPPGVLVQRDAEYLERFGRKDKLRFYSHHIEGLADCGVKPGRCYQFPMRREADRIFLAGEPKRIREQKPVPDSADEQTARPEEERESAA